jgi:hypothetical protein
MKTLPLSRESHHALVARIFSVANTTYSDAFYDHQKQTVIPSMESMALLLVAQPISKRHQSRSIRAATASTHSFNVTGSVSTQGQRQADECVTQHLQPEQSFQRPPLSVSNVSSRRD